MASGDTKKASGGARPEGRSGWLLVLLVVTATLVALLGTYKVWYHYQTVGIGYHLAEEIVRQRKLYGENRRLRLELESLEREGLQRLRREAPGRLRLPADEDLIVVRE